MEFVDLKKQYEYLAAEIQENIQIVLKHGQFILGPEVFTLEEKLAQYVGVKHCITVANGTDALLIAMMALGIMPGDEVITSPFTFIANAEMILLLGAKPVFVDIDPHTYLLNVNQIEENISKKTKCIMPISLYGQCADMDRIQEIAKNHQLAVIEDAAQSFGSMYKGKKSCGLSTIGCTSFFPSKPLGGYGDGGACFTDNDDLALKMRQIRVHGQARRYDHQCLGMNSRLDTLQAAILLAKLNHFEAEIQTREKIGQYYNESLLGVVKTMMIPAENRCVYAQYTIEVPERTKIQAQLTEAGIPTAIHYPCPLHLQPILKETIQKKFPYAEFAASHVLNLPIHPYLLKTEQDYIVDSLKKAITYNEKHHIISEVSLV